MRWPAPLHLPSVLLHLPSVRLHLLPALQRAERPEEEEEEERRHLREPSFADSARASEARTAALPPADRPAAGWASGTFQRGSFAEIANGRLAMMAFHDMSVQGGFTAFIGMFFQGGPNALRLT